MYLTLSKKFEVSFSRRLRRETWDEDRNRRAFGMTGEGNWGHGVNLQVYIILHGSVDSQTGMLVNLSDVKKGVKEILDQRYDHKFLNVDTSPFESVPPVLENIAKNIFYDISKDFAGGSAKPVACHVAGLPTASATYYERGTVERDVLLEFSAARRTYSPALSEEENARIFGKAAAPSGHGHHYRLRAVLQGTADVETGQIAADIDIEEAAAALIEELDHKNLSTDVKHFQSAPNTTEYLAAYCFERLSRFLPVVRLQLYELPWFFAEYGSSHICRLGMQTNFNSAHRLYNPRFTEAENAIRYGKCNHPSGHGHGYIAEFTVGGTLDTRSGTLLDFVQFQQTVKSLVAPYHNRHLDLETKDFEESPSTGENICQRLWQKGQAAFEGKITRVRLWETPNNKFTVRSCSFESGHG